MDNLKIKGLAELSMEELCASWNKAYSDYQANVQMAPGLLNSWFFQNDVKLELSAGAFLKGEFVGFWLNGLRNISGKNVAFNSGTAVWPEYRRKGIARALANYSCNAMEKLGARDFVLEVISGNDRAHKLYLSLGYKVTRTLRFFGLECPKFEGLKLPEGITIAELPLNEDIVKNLPQMEYVPSWQNQTQSMLNIKDMVQCLFAKRGNEVVGYVFLQPVRGRISQLGVNPDLWKTDVLSLILKRACEIMNGKEFLISNIEESASKTVGIVEKHGFKPVTDLLEMKRSVL